MPPLDWINLRTIDGDQRTAFEKLCCQLARDTQPDQGTDFVVKGSGGDAGVECFWVMENGDELAWQAKFFLSAPTSNQWSQIDDSVKTALDKHPRITHYTVCLPVDRSDARREGQTSFLDNWNQRVEKWTSWAIERSMQVGFSYCGETEIFKWLSEGPRGRWFYWFNKDYFDENWFQRLLNQATDLAGPRYTPQIHVELPVSKIFAALGRTQQFVDANQYRHLDLEKRFPRYLYTRVETLLLEKWNDFSNSLELTYVTGPTEEIDVGEINSKIADLQTEIHEITEKIEADETQSQQSKDSDISHLRELNYSLNNLREELRSSSWKVTNSPYLALVGDAGTGKTHLFCDVARLRHQEGHPTVILLGEQILDDISWQSILHELGLDCTVDDFLEALETVATVRNTRALIMIDALNESHNYSQWQSRLVSFVSKLSDYPRIGLVVSIRSPFDKQLLRQDLLDEGKVVLVEHHGFTGYEFPAQRVFFKHYNIPEPRVPLLNPEFSNPLFLKLFCTAFAGQNLDQLKSVRGITQVFTVFLNEVNSKLAHPDFLDYPEDEHIVQKAVISLVDAMIDLKDDRVPVELAREILMSMFPTDGGHSRSLYRWLTTEGVITEAPIWTGDPDKPKKGVRLAYQRLADHMIARKLLEQHLSIEEPMLDFQSGKPLHEVLLGDEWRYIQTNLIAAMSIQIPEKTGYELVELLPDIAEHWHTGDAFIESLIWRNWNTDHVPEKVIELLNGNGISVRGQQIFETLFATALDPSSPLNAHFLHRNLIRTPMTERDTSWGKMMHQIYAWSDNNNIERLIEWAWGLPVDADIDSETVHLSGIALCWLLISSNRFLRDSATKALVNLYSTRLNHLPRVLELFADIDDLYLLERLYAVAYGCVMRSSDNASLRSLSMIVYQQVFANNRPPANILLRGHAQGIIELAVSRTVVDKAEVPYFQPPYETDWIDEPPTKDELDNVYGQYGDDMSDEERGRLSIHMSVMSPLGDFGRYIVEGAVREWTSYRNNEEKIIPSAKRLRQFEETLTEDQQKLFRELRFPFRDLLDEIHAELRGEFDWDDLFSDGYQESYTLRLQEELVQRGYTDEKLDKEHTNIKQKFIESLEEQQKAEYFAFVDDHITSTESEPFDPDKRRFDPSIAERWILQRVFELGWTEERFGEFDFRLNRFHNRGRDAKKPERIGKKYQWLAFYEFLARLADNYHFDGDSWVSHDQNYEGIWQINIADIDPSSVDRGRTKTNWNSDQQSWWFDVPYDDWHNHTTHRDWVRSTVNLPQVEDLILVKDDEGIEWLSLDSFYEWKEPVSVIEEARRTDQGRFYILLWSYIVKLEHLDDIFNWAKAQDYHGRWMPETRHALYEIHLGEFYWSSAYQHFRTPAMSFTDWSEDENIPYPILVTSDAYSQEDNYDCSIESTISMKLPCRWLVDKMDLRWAGARGENKFLDSLGECVAMDPSLEVAGPSTLLINMSKLKKFLEDNGYGIFWTVLGEKELFSGNMGDMAFRGRTIINGAYRLNDGRLEGDIRGMFESGNEADKDTDLGQDHENITPPAP